MAHIPNLEVFTGNIRPWTFKIRRDLLKCTDQLYVAHITETLFEEI